VRDGLPCVRNPTLPLSPPSSSPPRLRWWWRRRVKHNENKSAGEALQTWMVLKGTFLVFLFCFLFSLFLLSLFFFYSFLRFPRSPPLFVRLMGTPPAAAHV
jgi:quinol-cytochrome oxidoreductase complex cytochrome b subunit